MRTPLGGAPSLGVNESQSRTWENLVGRSRPFWTHWYGPLQQTFPAQLGRVDLDAFVRAINRAEPGLIRVDADETTYSPPHHPAVRARAGPDRRHRRARGSAGDLERADEGVPRHRRPVERRRRAPGRALVRRRDRLLPDLRARQRDLAPDLGEGARGDSRPRRADGGRGPARAVGLAPRQPLRARPQADAEGDARAPHRVGCDRPAAVPRLPGREAGRARPRDGARRARAGGRPRDSRRPRARRGSCCSSSVPRRCR